MANSQHPGFAPAKTTGSSFQRVRKPGPDNGTLIRLNDAVVLNSSGLWVVATTTNSAVAGSSLGASYKNADGQRIDADALPATNTTGTTFLAEDRNWIYVAQDALRIKYIASIDEAVVQGGMNINYVMVLATTTTRVSDHELDATSPATTATFPWRVEEPFRRADLDPDAADAWFLCSINAGMVEPASSNYTGT